MGNWKARMSAHCGMAYTLAEGTRDDCQETIAGFLEKRRAEGFTVSALDGRAAWELTELEDAAMVPDTAGIVSLVPPPYFLCVECSSAFEEHIDAAGCCELEHQCPACDVWYGEEGDAVDCLSAHLDCLPRASLAAILERAGVPVAAWESDGELATDIRKRVWDGSIPFPSELESKN